MLQPFIDALIPFMPGYLELPDHYGAALWGVSKGAHKYLKRVPKAGGGYRYFYHVGHGGGIHHEDHFIPGAAFRFEGGHYHIKSEEGGKLVIEHDETKERKTVSKSELRTMLGAHHEPAIKAHREKVAGMLAEARANKASPKQIARLEARAKAVGVARGESVEDVLSEVPEYQRRAYRNDTAKELRAKAQAVRKQAGHTGDDDPSLKFRTADQIAQRKAEKHKDASFMERLADAKDRAETGTTERERAWISHLRQLSDKHGKASSRAKTSDASRKQSGLASFYDWTADHFEGKTKEPPKPGHRLGMVITGPTSSEAKGVPDERNALTAEEFAEAKRGLAKLGDPAKFATDSEQAESHVAQREAKDKRDRESRMAARTAEIKALEASERERKKRDWMGP